MGWRVKLRRRADNSVRIMISRLSTYLSYVLVLTSRSYRQATQESSQDRPWDGEDEGGGEGQEEEVRRCLLLMAMEGGGYGS